MTTVYVGTTEAACLLQLSSQRVRKLAIEGRIEGAFKDGLHWKIPLFNGMPKITIGKRGPSGRWRKIPQKVMTFIHIHQFKLHQNRKNKTRNPVILVRQGGKTTLCNELIIPGVGRIIYDPDNRKKCGATVWIEIDPQIELRMKQFI